jgi:large subunit ribosomal protein L10
MVLPESGVPGDGCHRLGDIGNSVRNVLIESQENLMPLALHEKKALVVEVNEVASSALSAIAAEYRGLTVGQMTDLRKQAREEGVYLKIIKNTLARLAVEGTEFECMKDGLTGPLMLAFSREHPGAAARVFKSFAKDNKKLVPTLVSIGGELLPPSELAKLADLPTREQALAMLLGVLQAPITKLARTLAEPHGKLVRTIAAIRDQKQAA